MNVSGNRVLIVEDDVPLGKFLNRELGRREYQVSVISDGSAARLQIESGGFDLLLLDLNLQEVDGFDLLYRFRAAWPSIPVIILTARNRTEDLVKALEDGADDFLAKPFSFQELLARIRRLLRRRPAPSSQGPSRIGDLTVNSEEYSVFRGGRRIDLTPREFGILEYLMNHAGKVVSRKALMEEVWQMPFDASTNVVDVYMKYLRDKIDSGEEKKLICTVRGVGYRLSYE